MNRGGVVGLGHTGRDSRRPEGRTVHRTSRGMSEQLERQGEIMRSNRFALVAGVLALGVAACGDDVQVVEPAPPPFPRLRLRSRPRWRLPRRRCSSETAWCSRSTPREGVAGDAASWTCASSNSGIASVSVVSAGCQATGVAAGSVTITATVTKSGETVNVGAQLTVTEEATGEPAFIIIKGVTGEPATSGGKPHGRQRAQGPGERESRRRARRPDARAALGARRRRGGGVPVVREQHG